MASYKRRNKCNFNKFNKKDEIIKFLKDNADYYTYEEFLEMIKFKFDFTWSNRVLLTKVFKQYGIDNPKQIPMKTIHIESVYRYIPDVERTLNLKNSKKEKEEKYKDIIQEKLNKLENIGKESNDTNTYGD